jgi:gluconate 5-dehydrogenase
LRSNSIDTKRMIPRGRGKIVIIGSLMRGLDAALRGRPWRYLVAEDGIKLLTQAMTAEWAAQGIQANAICPVCMIPEMTQALIDNPTFDA